MKRVLITGGTGFIGSNLVRYINSPSVKITVIDSLISGFEENLEGQNRPCKPNCVNPHIL